MKLSLPRFEFSNVAYCDTEGEADGHALTVMWGRFGFQLWFWRHYG